MELADQRCRTTQPKYQAQKEYTTVLAALRAIPGVCRKLHCAPRLLPRPLASIAAGRRALGNGSSARDQVSSVAPAVTFSETFRHDDGLTPMLPSEWGLVEGTQG